MSIGPASAEMGLFLQEKQVLPSSLLLIILAREGRLFIGAMHGSAIKGASNAEPPMRIDMDRAAITNCLRQ